ncbi:hypothetical protein ABE099_10710 [Paenibacillus turicensis]|uniref:hypothetical protein n=1 Tax=Paenibacillus turicensis TaxID=160487 RepID=UPI003D28DBF6
MQPDPPKPQVTYGEFQIRLEYEIDGQKKVIEDILICEFAGIGSDEGRGKFRKWKQRLKSHGGSEITLLKIKNEGAITFSPGGAEYYMGDSDYTEDNSSFPDAIFEEFYRFSFIYADQLFNDYKIKLLKWEADPPIENTYL